MTNVVAFAMRGKRRRAGPEGPCKILFFTGVRYMRGEDAIKRKSPKTTRPKKRRA